MRQSCLVILFIGISSFVSAQYSEDYCSCQEDLEVFRFFTEEEEQKVNQVYPEQQGFAYNPAWGDVPVVYIPPQVLEKVTVEEPESESTATSEDLSFFESQFGFKFETSFDPKPETEAPSKSVTVTESTTTTSEFGAETESRPAYTGGSTTIVTTTTTTSTSDDLEDENDTEPLLSDSDIDKENEVAEEKRSNLKKVSDRKTIQKNTSKKQKSKAVKSRIKRKSKKGRGKVKKQKRFKKYKGRCPFF